MSESLDRGEIRRTIKTVAETLHSAGRETVVARVAADEDVPPDAVEEEIDRMEKHGFVYLVDDEVRLP